MAAVDTKQSSKFFVFNYDDVVYPRDDYIDRAVRAYYPCVNAPFLNPPCWTLADPGSFSSSRPSPAPNFTGCMLQSGMQWRAVGGCFGGSGADQVCSNRGQMSPLPNTRCGTLDDDFNGVSHPDKWIYTDYGRTVVTPPKPDFQYIPALPYLQNGFALLQIAVQEARGSRPAPSICSFPTRSSRPQNPLHASLLAASRRLSSQRRYSLTPAPTCRGQ